MEIKVAIPMTGMETLLYDEAFMQYNVSFSVHQY